MKDLPIVITGLQRFDEEIGSNAVNMAKELSKTRKVLYVNMPPDLKSLRPLGTKTTLKEEAKNLWLKNPTQPLFSINYLPESKLHRSLARINSMSLANEIKNALEELGWREFVLLNDNDLIRSFWLKDFLNPRLYVFYLRDYLLEVPYWKKHGKSFEEGQFKKADIVASNSTYLQEYASKFSDNSYYIGQGVDTELVLNYADVNIKKDNPVIGYIGALSSLRLDLGLIEKIALAFPTCELALVGPEDEYFKCSSLHSLPNVRFYGKVPQEQIGAWINHFDVCLNPQLINRTTLGNYPRKLDEYLVLGKPVVARATPAMEIFKDYVYLANDSSEFLNYVQSALTEDPLKFKDHRVDFAKTHTWENSINALDQAITSFNYYNLVEA